MPLQNRVTPTSELVAEPGRGLVYGNRGCLHDADGRIRRRFNGKRWIACRLEFRGWHREPLLQPGRFTELFFLDEATAFAAGHRPCALCRREDYVRFSELWRELHPGQAGADAIDAQLHAERVAERRRAATARRAARPASGRRVRAGRGRAVARPRRRAAALDGGGLCGAPSSAAGAGERRCSRRRRSSQILRAGWSPAVPLLHPSASGRGRGGRGSEVYRPNG